MGHLPMPNTMNPRLRSATVALLCATLACSAFANGPRGPYPSYPQHQHRSHGGGGGNWVAPLLFLGLAGAVIGAAAANQPSAPPPPQPVYVPPQVTYVQPAPVYVAPPVAVQAPPQPPANAWYFCRSVGQYYPYTQHCPEGWQLVSPTPQ